MQLSFILTRSDVKKFSMVSACIFDLEGVILEGDSLAEKLGDIVEITPNDLKDGVFIFIKELKNKGLNLAAVSMSPGLRLVLNRLQITHYFHTLIDADKLAADASRKEAYTLAMRELGVSEAHTLVFTAQADGIAAASALDCYVVGVGVISELSQADLVLPSFERVRFLRILAAIGDE